MNRSLDVGNRLIDALTSGSVRHAVVAIVVVLIAALTAYHTTVAGIELALGDKADRAAVESLSQRLLTIETLLRTDVAQRKEFTDFRDEVQRRLTRIETMLDHTLPHRGVTTP